MSNFLTRNCQKINWRQRLCYECNNQLITWWTGITRTAGSWNLVTLKTNFAQYKNFVWPIFSFLWRIWKWKENGTKKLTFPDGDLTLDFWTGFRPRFEFWGRLDQSSSRFLKNLDFNFFSPRSQRCVFPVSDGFIMYCHSSKSTGKESGKTHLCVMY